MQRDAGPTADGGDTCAATPPTPVKPPSSCDVVLESPAIPVGYRHVPEGTAVTYCSNPPSGGDHYPVWAAFQEYTTPVPWPYLVHDLEHGAVLLLYNCPAGCDDVVAQYRTLRDQADADPLCDPGTKRIIIAPSPTLPTKIAAAAWGQTYTADCIDVPTLQAFLHDHYGNGPEQLCAQGETF